MITYVDKSKSLFLELASEFSKVTSHKVKIKHHFYFYILATLKNKIFKISLANNVCGNDKASAIKCYHLGNVEEGYLEFFVLTCNFSLGLK